MQERETLSGSGILTDGLAIGGRDDPGSAEKADTEGYDGTNWSTRPSLATARHKMAASHGPGTATAAFVAGGTSPVVANTEEFTGDTTALGTAKTIDFD